MSGHEFEKLTGKDMPKIAPRLASQSAMVMSGYLFTLLVGFPFNIYVARTLGAKQLGAFGLFDVIAQASASIFGFGLGFALVRFIPQYIALGQNRHVSSLLSRAFLITLAAGGFIAAVVTAGGSCLIKWMPALRAYASLFPLVGAMAFLALLFGLFQQALRAFLDIRYMVLTSSFLKLALKVITALALLSLSWALRGYLIAVVVSSGLALACMAWGVRRHVRRMGLTCEEVRPETRKTWWSYSRTVYGTSLLGMVRLPLERFLLAGMINLASVGILMVVRQLQNFPQVFLNLITTAVAPTVVASRARGNMAEVKHVYHIATDWLCRLGLPLLIFMIVFGNKVLAIYGHAFEKAGQLPLLILISGQAVNLLTGPAGPMLNVLGHEREMFRLNMVSNMIGAGSLFAFVPFLGLSGAALGASLAMAYNNIAALLIMKKKLGINWWSARLSRLLAPLGAVILALIFTRMIIPIAGMWQLALFLLLSYGVFIAVYARAGFSSEDMEVLSHVKGKIMTLAESFGGRGAQSIE